MPDIERRVRDVLDRLEARDDRERREGVPTARRLRQIRPEVGVLLRTLVLATAARRIVEIGTSGGYSTVWLALGARTTGGRVLTLEVDPAKVELAAETFRDSGVDDVVEVRQADALDGFGIEDATADLVFLDADKDVYERLLEPVVRALRPGGLLVADNLVSHAEELEGFERAALGHPLLSGLVVPLGRGELVAVKSPS